MSIDHGKLLALASEIQSAVGQAIEPDVQHVPVTWLLDWAERLRALAQPAEAREYCPCMKEDCPKCYAIQSTEAVEGGKCRMCGAPCTEHKREIAPGDYVTSYRYEADAAQGAVAWSDEQCVEFMRVALRHTEYKRGNSGPTVTEIRQGAQRAMALTHPQAAPAQGDDHG